MLPLVQELILLNSGLNRALGSNGPSWSINIHDAHIPAWKIACNKGGFSIAAQDDGRRRLEGGFSSIIPLESHDQGSPLELAHPSHAINVLKRYKELLPYVTTKRPAKLPLFKAGENPVYQYETVVPAMMVADCSAGSGFRFGCLVHVAFESPRGPHPTYDCCTLRPQSFRGVEGFHPQFMGREYYVYQNQTALIGDTIDAKIERRFNQLLANSLFLEIEHELVLGMIEFEVSPCALPYFYAHMMLESFFPNPMTGSTDEIRTRRLLHNIRKRILMTETADVMYPITPMHVVSPTLSRYAQTPVYLV